VQEAKIAPPAMTIIGKVVRLRQTLNWFERRPLFGKTIVVTRPVERASELSRRLTELGANVIEQPTIQLVAPQDHSALDAQLRDLAQSNPDWIIFTSPAGVAFTMRRLFKIGLDARALGSAKIGVIGEATASVVRSLLALRVDACPQEFVAEALADELIRRGEVSGKQFVLLRADIARPLLVQRLREAGAKEIRDVAIYENKPVLEPSAELMAALQNKQIDWIAFTSSSTASNLIAMLGPNAVGLLNGIRLASIGPVTSQTLRAAAFEPIEASRHDIGGLIEAILECR